MAELFEDVFIEKYRIMKASRLKTAISKRVFVYAG